MLLKDSIVTGPDGINGLYAATLAALRPGQRPDTVREWADDSAAFHEKLFIVGPAGSGRTFTAHAAIGRYLACLRGSAANAASVEGRSAQAWFDHFREAPSETVMLLADASVVLVEDLFGLYTPDIPAPLDVRLNLGRALAWHRGRLVVTVQVEAPRARLWLSELDQLIADTYGEHVASLLGNRATISIT